MFLILKTIIFISFSVLLSSVGFCENLKTQTDIDNASLEPSYIGSNQCKLCHRIWYESWEHTGMSNSFNLLKPGARYRSKIRVGLDPDKDYRRDEKCLVCHSVGYNKPGGFNKNISFADAEIKGLLGVGCEMCHGPGSEYWQLMPKFKKGEVRESDLVDAGLILPGRTNKGETCANDCHNKNHAFHREFNFQKTIKKDTQFGGKGIHDHFKLRTLKKYFNDKHDFNLKVDIKYIFKFRKGREIQKLGQPPLE